MGLLSMNQKEYDYFIENITEAFALIGQDAKLYQVLTEEKDLYRDPDLTHKEFVEVGIVFEENPRPILKKFNWMTEDEELPYVCYLVAKDKEYKEVEIRENMLLVVPSVYGLVTERTFLISSVRANHIDPLVWICKLVPHRNKVDMIPETQEYDRRLNPQTDVDFSYLKR